MIGLGKKLKAARKAKGLTQEQVARRLQVHRTTYTKYEKDQCEPSLETLCRLAVVLELQPAGLLPPADNSTDHKQSKASLA